MAKYKLNELERGCRATRTQLSLYVDSTLSAREVWAIEKHLRACKSCSDYRRELQATVDLLHTTPRLDTSDDFMARLHSRIDAIEPALVRPPQWRVALQDQWMTLWYSRPVRSLSAVGLSLLVLALVPTLVRRQPVLPSLQREDRAVREARRALTQPLSQNVVSSTEDPFGDPSATNLEAQVVLNDSSTSKTSKEN